MQHFQSDVSSGGRYVNLRLFTSDFLEVALQELGINPTTLTPEMMLFFARVVSGSENGAAVVRLCRPGLGMVSFAGDDLKDEEREEDFSWNKILEMQWRLVSSS